MCACACRCRFYAFQSTVQVSLYVMLVVACILLCVVFERGERYSNFDDRRAPEHPRCDQRFHGSDEFRSPGLCNANDIGSDARMLTESCEPGDRERGPTCVALVKKALTPRDWSSAGWYTLSVCPVFVQALRFHDFLFWTCILAAFGPTKSKR